MKSINKYCTTQELRAIKQGDSITNGRNTGVVANVVELSVAWGIRFIFTLANGTTITQEI